MDDDAGDFSIPVSHQDQVVVAPPGARIFASSAFTPFAGLEYGDALSFQGHPEFAPDYAAALIETRRDLLPDPDAAIASLDGRNDRGRVADWIGRFLAG